MEYKFELDVLPKPEVLAIKFVVFLSTGKVFVELITIFVELLILVELKLFEIIGMLLEVGG